MSRFDPEEGKAYAECVTCDETLLTRDDMLEHLHETFKAGRSHRAQTINATRVERIERELSYLAEDAINELVERFHELVGGGDVTAEEVTEALTFVHIDAQQIWRESNE